MLFLIIGMLVFAVPSLYSQASSLQNTQIFLGFELIELQQNAFQNLGPENITFFIGFSQSLDDKTAWGLRYNLMQVELSENHLKEPSPAFGGDFSGVTGKLGVHRLYLDYYYLWDLDWFTIKPIASLALGYNSWDFQNSLVNQDYHLHSFSVGF